LHYIAAHPACYDRFVRAFRLLNVLALAIWPAVAADLPGRWLEVSTPNFAVLSNGGERPARQVAERLEQIRGLVQQNLALRVEPGKPLRILAARDEATLRELLPSYWETPGSLHPSGYFLGAEEKNFIALRLDSPSDSSSTVYHEYVHLLVHLNLPSLPLWLNEGLAGVVGMVGQNGGLPPARWMPLRDLFAVTRDSPDYHETGRALLFQSQARLLTQMLLLGNSQPDPGLLELLRLLRQGVDASEAQRQAFPDLGALETRLEAYSRQSKRPAWSLPASRAGEAGVRVRELPPAEAAAVRADFLVFQKRWAEAQALLDDALRLDPKLPSAHETMGFLFLKQDRRPEALAWFARAVEHGSGSYLAHYWYALLSLPAARERKALEPVRRNLERAVELNPGFAAGYAALAGAWIEDRERALSFARHAVELEPDVTGHLLEVGNILFALGRLEEALDLAERMRAMSRTPNERASAQALLNSLRQRQAQP
jgi:tetratricopeptide (TPR) repeat protein